MRQSTTVPFIHLLSCAISFISKINDVMVNKIKFLKSQLGILKRFNILKFIR